MANPVWDGLVTYAAIAAGANTSGTFNIAKNTGSVSFIIPDLDNGVTLVHVQGLDPQDKTTWRDVAAYDVTAGGASDPIILPDNTYNVVPASALGGGTFRLQTYAAGVLTAVTTAATVSIIIDRIY